jgi:hypothetical protein
VCSSSVLVHFYFVFGSQLCRSMPSRSHRRRRANRCDSESSSDVLYHVQRWKQSRSCNDAVVDVATSSPVESVAVVRLPSHPLVAVPSSPVRLACPPPSSSTSQPTHAVGDDSDGPNTFVDIVRAPSATAVGKTTGVHPPVFMNRIVSEAAVLGPEPKRRRLTTKRYVPMPFTSVHRGLFADTVCNIDLGTLPLCYGHLVEADMAIMIATFLEYDMAFGFSKASIAWTSLLHRAFPECANVALSDILTALVGACLHNRQIGESRYDMIEYWSGLAHVTLEHAIAGLRCLRFDSKYTTAHNTCQRYGLKQWILSMIFTTESSTQWFSPPCESFCGLCKSVSKRDASNGFLGDVGRAFVLDGNYQCELCSLLYFLSFLLGNQPLYETPLSGCTQNTTCFVVK